MNSLITAQSMGQTWLGLESNLAPSPAGILSPVAFVNPD